MNFLTNLLTTKFSFDGRSDNNGPSLLLPTMFLIHLSLMAATIVQCHPLVEHLLLRATLLVLIHIILPMDLPLFVNIVIVVVTLLKLTTNYMVILQIILVVKQIRLIRILAPNLSLFIRNNQPQITRMHHNTSLNYSLCYPLIMLETKFAQCPSKLFRANK